MDAWPTMFGIFGLLKRLIIFIVFVPPPQTIIEISDSFISAYGKRFHIVDVIRILVDCKHCVVQISTLEPKQRGILLICRTV